MGRVRSTGWGRLDTGWIQRQFAAAPGAPSPVVKYACPALLLGPSMQCTTTETPPPRLLPAAPRLETLSTHRDSCSTQVMPLSTTP